MKKRDRRNFYIGLSVFILVAVLILLGFSIVNRVYLKQEIGEKIEGFGLIGVLVFSFFLDLIPQYIAPHAILTASLVLGFTMWKTLAAAVIGSAMGSLLGFEIGRKFSSKAQIIESIFGKKKTDYVKKKINNIGKWFVIIAAVSPLPYIPIVLGMIQLSRKNLIKYGIIPRILGLSASALIVYGII